MHLAPRILKGIRVTHLYLGVFVAPALLFFAFTGAIQTFSLHETTPGSNYHPPRILVVLGQIHKKQTPVLPVRKPQAPAPATTSNPDHRGGGDSHDTEASGQKTAPEPVNRHNAYPLKIFFLVVAISLCLSTLTGISMAWAYSRNKAAIVTLLLLGAMIPLVMVLL